MPLIRRLTNLVRDRHKPTRSSTTRSPRSSPTSPHSPSAKPSESPRAKPSETPAPSPSTTGQSLGLAAAAAAMARGSNSSGSPQTSPATDATQASEAATPALPGATPNSSPDQGQDTPSAAAFARGDQLEIDRDECIGCGTCVENDDSVFWLNDDEGKAYVLTQKSNMKYIQDAIDACPVTCISWESVQ